MFKTIYLRTEENQAIHALAVEAGLSDSKFIVTKCLENSRKRKGITTVSDLFGKS